MVITVSPPEKGIIPSGKYYDGALDEGMVKHCFPRRSRRMNRILMSGWELWLPIRDITGFLHALFKCGLLYGFKLS